MYKIYIQRVFNHMLLAGLLCLSASSFGEEVKSATDKHDDDALVANKLYLTPVPVIGYNPANGTIYGVGASASYYFGDPESTKLSNLLAGLAHTSLGQTIILFKSTAFSANNVLPVLGRAPITLTVPLRNPPPIAKS